MKYADSIKVLKNNLWNNTKCKEIVKGCDEIIQNQEDIVDVVRAAIVDTENQILIWEKEQEETPNCDFPKEIILFQIISEFYRLNGRLAFAFLATNHNELKRIRNQNEAHKTEEFDIQVKSIEDLKVSESINLIYFRTLLQKKLP